MTPPEAAAADAVPPAGPDRGAADFRTAFDRWYAGCEAALLRKAAYLVGRCSGDHSLAGHNLINEAITRLLESDRRQPRLVNDSDHFKALVANVMLHALVDHARSRDGPVRGGDRHRTTLSTSFPLGGGDVMPLVDFWMLIEKLQQMNELHARIVVLATCGYTTAETALAVGKAPSTVKREMGKARGWLERKLGRGANP